MKQTHPVFKTLMMLLLAASLSACSATARKHTGNDTGTTESANTPQVVVDASQPDDEFGEEKSEVDPWEGFNRAMYRFNNVLDKAVLKPVAKGYVKITNKPVRKGVSNFFSNLTEPTTIINDVLQGKFKQSAKDTARFVVNSTAGVLGIFDVAKHINLQKNSEDFGQTFGRWGAGTGPYLVLPIFGPSNVRDGIGRIPQALYTDLIPYIGDGSTTPVLLQAGRIIDVRTNLLQLDKLLEQQIDPYVFMREGYLQSRLKAVHDGNPPVKEDEFLDEDLLAE